MVGLGVGRVMTSTETNGKLVIAPIGDLPAYDLADLLSGMTNENLHGESDTGFAVGNEF